MMKNQIESLHYEDDKEKIKFAITEMSDKNDLHLFFENYNWDDGFEIPRMGLENPICELATALMIFYLADGYSFLIHKNDAEIKPRNEWEEFMELLYKRIINNDFCVGEIRYDVPLTKVQKYKMNKLLTSKEKIFIEGIA